MNTISLTSDSPLSGMSFQLDGNTLSTILTHHSDAFIFIKNNRSIYQYANTRFIELMGLKKLSDLVNKNDCDLCRDKLKSKSYLEDDEKIIEEEKILTVSEEIRPKYNGFVTQHMSGELIPLYSQNSSKPQGILGIVKPTFRPFKLDLETLFLVEPQEISQWLLKSSYSIKVHNHLISLSRREIQCLIELLKGRHAGEIASVLSLKQTTVESYLMNIRNKLGSDSKSSLIHTILTEKILQQIIL